MYMLVDKMVQTYLSFVVVMRRLVWFDSLKIRNNAFQRFEDERQAF